MRFVELVVMLGVAATLLASQLTASSPFFDEPPPLNFQVYGGFREDYLKFHIGGDKPHPKVFSQVRWKNLKIAEIGASINYSTCHNYYMRASGDVGKIMRGRGSVSNEFTVHQHHHDEVHHHHDKKGNSENQLDHLDHLHHHHSHKHHEFSKEKADAGYGYVCDFSGGFGWKVISGGGRSWIAGLIGYSYNRQDLKMRHFEVEKDSRDVLKDVNIDNLRGSYLTRWIGPWIGFDISSQIECDVTAFATGEWHHADYRAEGSWSLCDDYSAKFRHHARGWGAVGTFGFDWRPCDRWGFGVLAKYQQWSTRRGKNHAKVCNNQFAKSDRLPSTFPIAEKSKLFRVKWISYSISAVVAYQY